MATIYDVAKTAGVSAKTVSRVLNDDAPVADKTRAGVQAAMQQLNYIPSSAARSIRSNKTGLIGLITGAITQAKDINDPAGLPDIFIVQGIQSVVAESNMTLLISDTGGHHDRVPHLIRTFQQHRVEGLIYVADYHQEVALPLTDAPLKVVLANCYDARGTQSVVPDDRDGQYQLVKRLTAAGHERIGFLTLPASLVATDERAAGYRSALQDAGLAYDPALVVAVDYFGHGDEQRLIWDPLQRLLRARPAPTVICCGNDRIAMAAYGMLRSQNISVPQEISVAGYDNYRLISETLFPPLTTVELPYHKIGVEAAKRLLARINNQPDAGDATKTSVRGPVCWRQSVIQHESKAR